MVTGELQLPRWLCSSCRCPARQHVNEHRRLSRGESVSLQAKTTALRVGFDVYGVPTSPIQCIEYTSVGSMGLVGSLFDGLAMRATWHVRTLPSLWLSRLQSRASVAVAAYDSGG